VELNEGIERKETKRVYLGIKDANKQKVSKGGSKREKQEQIKEKIRET
jgi:pyrimidine deaminase RibD-like protein